MQGGENASDAPLMDAGRRPDQEAVFANDMVPRKENASRAPLMDAGRRSDQEAVFVSVMAPLKERLCSLWDRLDRESAEQTAQCSGGSRDSSDKTELIVILEEDVVPEIDSAELSIATLIVNLSGEPD